MTLVSNKSLIYENEGSPEMVRQFKFGKARRWISDHLCQF